MIARARNGYLGPGQRMALQSQTGVALITALIILLILTIIGITALNTSALQGRMAGSIQDSTFAFQAAESGLADSSNSSLDLYAPVQSPVINYGRATAQVVTTFKAFAPVKRSNNLNNMYGQGFSAANFDQVSTGQVKDSHAKAIVDQGTMQIVPSQNN